MRDCLTMTACLLASRPKSWSCPSRHVTTSQRSVISCTDFLFTAFLGGLLVSACVQAALCATVELTLMAEQKRVAVRYWFFWFAGPEVGVALCAFCFSSPSGDHEFTISDRGRALGGSMHLLSVCRWSSGG